jgi:hypothetical protein
MPQESLSRKRVSVQRDPYCFVVVVDTQPVLRCAARRDAFRYAVLVRRALERADLIRGDGALKRSLKRHKIHN